VAIITAQQIVCQEENVILEIFLKNFHRLTKRDFSISNGMLGEFRDEK
jgi:hypothetical protein